jgi:hypothetical protein
MTCACVLVAGWIVSFLVPTTLLFVELRPTSRWDLALIWGGIVTSPLHAFIVKVLLRGVAHGDVSYVAALVASMCGALVYTMLFMAELSSPPAGVGFAGAYLSTVGLASGIASIAVTGTLVWDSARSTTAPSGWA